LRRKGDERFYDASKQASERLRFNDVHLPRVQGRVCQISSLADVLLAPVPKDGVGHQSPNGNLYGRSE